MEKLQGTDVLTCLSQRHEYTEQMVASIITQVNQLDLFNHFNHWNRTDCLFFTLISFQILDGLQYLHWRGIAHLDLQPDNVLLVSARSLEVKLCDMGSARRVSKLGTPVLCPHALPAYMAPEILNDEPAFPQSDVWSLGVLTYVLLSGVSPFRFVCFFRKWKRIIMSHIWELNVIDDFILQVRELLQDGISSWMFWATSCSIIKS